MSQNNKIKEKELDRIINGKCIYPNWDGTFSTGEHKYDKNGFCIICGKLKYSPAITSKGDDC